MINANRIQELRDEIGPDDLKEVIDLFCEEVEEVLSTLNVTPQDRLAAQLHFLKGSALNIGLDGVIALCLSEEKRLKSDPNATPDIGAIQQAYADARPYLAKI